APRKITIEHVRDAFMSESASRERDRDMRKRHATNDTKRLELAQNEKAGSRVTNGDLRRVDAITRQKGECLYCGENILFNTCEMDHIGPRRGVGSTNTRSNLVAACLQCNRSKGNTPFAVWANEHPNEAISVQAA